MEARGAIDTVKVKIQAKACISPDLQRQTFSGKQLEDGRMGETYS